MKITYEFGRTHVSAATVEIDIFKHTKHYIYILLCGVFNPTAMSVDTDGNVHGTVAGTTFPRQRSAHSGWSDDISEQSYNKLVRFLTIAVL